jgi:hypothetical protein
MENVTVFEWWSTRWQKKSVENESCGRYTKMKHVWEIVEHNSQLISKDAKS